MKKSSMWLAVIFGLSGMAPNSYAVEYVKVCATYGSGYHYVAGTDVCLNEFSGQAIQAMNAMFGLPETLGLLPGPAPALD